MTRKIAFMIATGAFTLAAADVWTTKDYTQWNTEETRKVLMNSPWAKETSTSSESVGGQPGGNGGSSRRGGMGGGMGGGGMGGGRRGGGGSAPRQAVVSQKVTVRWESALPEKEAQLKSQFGDHLPAKDDPAYTLDKPENSYRISITGLQLSAPRSRGYDDSSDSRSSIDRAKDQLMGSTQLVRKGKDPIYPQDIKIDPSLDTITFLFPKSDAITADDKEVEFTTAAGRLHLKRKFSLKEMMFSGKLEL